MLSSPGWMWQWGCPICCEGGCVWDSGVAPLARSCEESSLSSPSPRRSPRLAGRSSLGPQHQERPRSGGHCDRPVRTERSRSISPLNAQLSNLRKTRYIINYLHWKVIWQLFSKWIVCSIQCHKLFSTCTTVCQILPTANPDKTE